MTAATTHAEVLAGLAALEAEVAEQEGVWIIDGVRGGFGMMLDQWRASIDLARLVIDEHAPGRHTTTGGRWCASCGKAVNFPCDLYRAAALVAGVDLDVSSGRHRGETKSPCGENNTCATKGCEGWCV